MPVVAIPNRWDWFEVPFAEGQPIGQVPGVRYVNGKFHLHRSHLPLIGASDFASTSCYRTHDQRSAEVEPHGLKLRPNQQTGLDFIEPRRGVLLADEMRLGKTLTALLAHDPNQGPLVIIAPLSTRAVWLNWIRVLWPDVTPVVITGKTVDPERLTSSPIVFGHFDILTHHRVASLKPGTLIVDEAHLISSNSGSNRSQRMDAIHFYASVAKRVILLTGTPLWNTSRGLWALLAATNPGAWGKIFDFSQRYCRPVMGEYGWQYNGVSNEEEWIKRRDEVLLCRRWADVRSDLPPIQRNLEMVDLDAKALRAVDQLAYELRLNVKTCTLEDLNHYRQATGLYKAPIGADLAMRVLAEKNDVVCWVWHKKVAAKVAEILTKKGQPAFVVTGDDSATRREEILDAWKAHPEPAALILTIAVGQVGIDLSRAHHAIFIEWDWTPLFVSQAEMRTFHPDRPMSITYVVINHEIELMMIDAVMSKVGTGDSIGMPAAGSEFGIPRGPEDFMSDDDLMAGFQRLLSDG